MKLWRFIVLSLIAAAAGIAVHQLGHTRWADHVRARSRTPPSMAELQARDRRPTRRGTDGPQILKVVVFMGVPGLITLAGKKLVSRKRPLTAASQL